MANHVPIYLPGRTVIGKAHISDEGHTIIITIPSSAPIAELVLEDLIGLGVIYMNNDARDRVNEGEGTDGG